MNRIQIPKGQNPLRLPFASFRLIFGLEKTFVPVGRGRDGKPDPRFAIIGGEPTNSKGGAFYLDWREDGKRRQKPCGTTPREALDAWHLQSGILSGARAFSEYI
jgi:hypothetical protein